MDELLSKFPAITEDIFENLEDESLCAAKKPIGHYHLWMKTPNWKVLNRSRLQSWL